MGKLQVARENKLAVRVTLEDGSDQKMKSREGSLQTQAVAHGPALWLVPDGPHLAVEATTYHAVGGLNL